MPDAHGNFKGTGYSPRAAGAWERIFGKPHPSTTAAREAYTSPIRVRRLPDPVRDTMPHAAGWPRRPMVTTPSEAVVRSREYLADLREDGPQ